VHSVHGTCGSPRASSRRSAIVDGDSAEVRTRLAGDDAPRVVARGVRSHAISLHALLRIGA
jgi:hypothetical protein